MTDAPGGATSTESDGGSLRRVGGGAAIALAAAYLAIISPYAFAGSTPTGGEEWLIYLETPSASSRSLMPQAYRRQIG